MNPFEHGEVFVLEDGGEVDMDFGHYERFLNINCKSSWNLTTGKIFDVHNDGIERAIFNEFYESSAKLWRSCYALRHVDATYDLRSFHVRDAVGIHNRRQRCS